jgi:ribose/xylose/arabinose/galactoside ABC-type transport system permease subunit
MPPRYERFPLDPNHWRRRNAAGVSVFTQSAVPHLMNPLESDLGVYVVSGVFALVVFAVAMTVLVTRTAVDLSVGTVATFSVGFLLFVGVYFTAMAIYRGIDSREDVK